MPPSRLVPPPRSPAAPRMGQHGTEHQAPPDTSLRTDRSEPRGPPRMVDTTTLATDIQFRKADRGMQNTLDNQFPIRVRGNARQCPSPSIMRWRLLPPAFARLSPGQAGSCPARRGSSCGFCRYRQARCLGSAQPGRIGCGQRGTRLQARHRLEEAHDFIGTQHHRSHAYGIRSGRSD
jgi:hypothetical protein